MQAGFCSLRSSKMASFVFPLMEVVPVLVIILLVCLIKELFSHHCNWIMFITPIHLIACIASILVTTFPLGWLSIIVWS